MDILTFAFWLPSTPIAIIETLSHYISNNLQSFVTIVVSS